jgi:hypothetical protein
MCEWIYVIYLRLYVCMCSFMRLCPCSYVRPIAEHVRTGMCVRVSRGGGGRTRGCGCGCMTNVCTHRGSMRSMREYAYINVWRRVASR